MYLPRLPNDPHEVAGHAISFDGFCQITTSDLLLATRIASLSLVSWHIFASFSRVVVARANDREAEMRKSVEFFDPPQEPPTQAFAS